MATILVGGDIYPVGNIQDAFFSGNAQEIFHDLLDDISRADLAIVNLEAPLVTKETPIQKPGGVLCARAEAIRGFVAANLHVLNLANNHSFDQGAEGLTETITTIKDAGLACVGAGLDIDEASAPLIKEINGERIVLYSMAEREFSIADRTTPGSNPFDLINFVRAVRRYKQDGVFIALIHGGQEYYPYPTPEMVRRFHFMVDMGADAVISCHTHCPLPWEIYADRPIVYGLGNLLFEATSKKPDGWYEGYLAILTIDNSRISFDKVPYFQSLGQNGTLRMNKHVRKRFLQEMARRSDQIKDVRFLENEWTKYCREHRNTYLSMLLGFGRLRRKLRRVLPYTLPSKEALLRALLLAQCETHQEILNTIFKSERHEDKT